MKPLDLAILAAVLFSLLGATSTADTPRPASLLSNGDMEAAGQSSNWPDAWPHPEGASWEMEGQNHFLRLRASQPARTLVVYRVVKLRPEDEAYSLRFRVRYSGLKRGKENWHDGRIILDFKDALGKKLKSGVAPPSFTGDSNGWLERQLTFLKPDVARTFEIMPALFWPEAGTLDLDDITLVSIPAEPLRVARAAAEAKEAARIASLPRPVPKVAVPAADTLPEELHVVGRNLQTRSGRVVWLQGLAIPSLEWSAGGEHVLESIRVAIDRWNANCIRLPIRDDFWTGHGPYQNDGGLGYRQLIDDAVNSCGGRGAYIVLDLHRFRAPGQEHLAFWKDLAGRYKNHPAVLFELFNEPHDISWKVWRDGGFVSDEKSSTVAAAENSQGLKGFSSVGMQSLLETIRREGAKNIVIAGGLDWGYDLSGILKGYALDDRGGHGVVYSSHVYPWKGDWPGKFLALAASYPLFLGEVGADIQKMDFLPANRQEDPYTWVPDMLGLIQSEKLNWTAWNFHPKSTPRVILDWTYTPTPFWGAFVKKALAHEPFVSKKMR